MAFLVQDDNGSVANANAYITVEFFKSYHQDRGNVIPGSPTDPDLERAIVRATDYLDQRFAFVGRRLRNDQTTEWPRISAYDRDRYLVNGIPPQVKEATAQYALRALSAELNPDPARDSTGAKIQSKSQEVGPIAQSITYVSGAVFEMPTYPAADSLLRRSGLTVSGGLVLRS